MALLPPGPDADRRARQRFSAYVARLQRYDGARRAAVESRRRAFERRCAAVSNRAR